MRKAAFDIELIAIAREELGALGLDGREGEDGTDNGEQCHHQKRQHDSSAVWSEMVEGRLTSKGGAQVAGGETSEVVTWLLTPWGGC